MTTLSGRARHAVDSLEHLVGGGRPADEPHAADNALDRVSPRERDVLALVAEGA